MGNNILARKALLLVTGSIWILSSLPALADEQILSLPKVVEYSLQHNSDLKSFREEKGIFDAGRLKAGLLPNPTLDLEAGTGALTGSDAESTLSIGISQEFLLAGKRSKRLAVAERDLDLYKYQLADKERLIIEEVKTLFCDVILAEQRLTLADRSIALNRQLWDISKERLAAGDIAELELNLVKIELARSEVSRIDVAKALRQNQEKLSAIAGLPAGTQYPTTGTLQSTSTLTRALAELKQLALAQRPDMKALKTERERGEAGVRLARAESVPNLTVGLSAWRDTRSMKIGGLEGTDKAYTIMMKLSMPIPLFDRNQAGVQEARARLSSAESRLSSISRNIEREVETAYASYLSSEKILSLYKTDIIPQLEENLNLTREAWRLGELGILTVIQEQKKFFEVSDNYLMALYNRQTALVKLDSAVGTELNGGVE
ncbi:MAG: TolC family protein [Chlorobium sp.]|nr:MAG: TolC family protein [Chlorobium sp.]